MRSVETDFAEVPLQPPGAGLPWAELAAARLGMRIVRWSMSRRRASRIFRQEADRILSLSRSMPAEIAAQRVLIPRVFGIEDSSRYWSVLMVLDHLVIVNDAIVQIVQSLAAGKPFEREIGIADVKPNPDQSPAIIERFAASAADYLAAIDTLPKLLTRLCYRHPWFGPLDGQGWHILAAIHMRIHRRQVQRIVAVATGSLPTP